MLLSQLRRRLHPIVAVLATMTAFHLATACAHAADPPGALHPPAPVSMDAIKKAWQVSAARLHSAILEFETRTNKETRALKEFDKRTGATTRAKSVDDAHSEYWRFTRMSIDGLRMRWEVLFKENNGNTPPERLCMEVSDGNGSKSLTMPGELSAFPYPIGYIRSQTLIPAAAHLVDTLPILMVTSRLLPQVVDAQQGTLSLDKYTIAKRRARLANSDCVILEQGDPKARKRNWVQNGVTFTDGVDHYYEQLWLDPSKDYAIVRYMSYVNTMLCRQIDFQLKDDSYGNAIPQSWTMTFYNASNGKISEMRESRVTLWMSNPKFKPSEFDFTFPPGTVVSGYSHGNRLYIVGAEGTIRPVSSHDLEGRLNHSQGK
jgi:hypothetical protein